jgi:hypothetical protein
MMGGMAAFIVALMVAMTAQPAGRVPARIGDIATVLSDADLAEVMRVSGCGEATPWLLSGSRGMMTDVQFVEVFCAADAVSGSVRRGPLAWVIRKSATTGGWSPWALQSTHRYAQLVDAVPGFTDIDATRDPKRPIRVEGTVADQDLVRIVKFLRDSPSKIGGTARERVDGSWPVTRVSLQPDGTIMTVLSKNPWESQRVVLRRTAQGWEVISFHYVIA